MLSDKMQPMVERRMLGGGTVIHVYRIPDGLKKKQPIAGIRVDWGTLERSIHQSDLIFLLQRTMFS